MMSVNTELRSISKYENDPRWLDPARNAYNVKVVLLEEWGRPRQPIQPFPLFITGSGGAARAPDKRGLIN